MKLLQIAVLAVIQGLAELLPVSSSAHVVVAERLMGIDPSAPDMTFLLVMLHTGTTFAVILYFWPRWKARFLTAGRAARAELVKALVVATAATGALGLVLKRLIEKTFVRGGGSREVESLFSNLPLVAVSLAAAGALILWAGSKREEGALPLSTARSAWIGLLQGLCLPFRGFSRSGATISAGLLLGLPRALAEDFSFALAVILTPPVIAIEGHRMLKAARAAGRPVWSPELFTPGLIGMLLSFAAGLLALRWLSSWLERGRWRWFGWYCLAASAAVLAVASRLG
ncbi:MAG TPA: undecaprenyl-diphosphate phosphatase [Elusimicrobiota bacterium]|nr:undecaprenyl-diphosphate phosphatase [Elusimicrobiota bacterium]